MQYRGNRVDIPKSKHAPGPVTYLCYPAVLSVDVTTGVVLCSHRCDCQNITCCYHDLGCVEADSTDLSMVTELTVL